MQGDASSSTASGGSPAGGSSLADGRSPAQARSTRRGSLLRYRAERLMRKDFSGLQPSVLATVRSRLAARGAQLDGADLDACYAQAWHGLYDAMLNGERIDDVAAWIVVVTFRRAIDELRARARQEALSKAYANGRAWERGDVAAELDDRATLRRVFEALNSRLSPRERRAATLCYLHGLSRAQAAQQMGVSEARMRKLMDGSPGKPGVATKVHTTLDAIGANTWCDQQGSLVRAYAFGILAPDGERHRLAQAHLDDCPSCRALVLFLRGLASILPPLPLPLDTPRASRARAARSMRRRVSARALLPKLALAGVVVLGIGAERAPLAGRATGHAGRPAVTARAPQHSRSRRPARRVAHRRAAHAARRAQPVAAPPATLIVGAPSSQAPAKALAPLGEFSPERPARTR